MSTQSNTTNASAATTAQLSFKATKEEFLDARAQDVALIRGDFARKDLESAMHGMQCQIDEWKMFLAATKSAIERH